jgi:hypothetical protein
VPPTPSSGSAATDWTQSPIGYVERGYGPDSPIPDLSTLAPATRSLLLALATGNNEPVPVMIGRICEFLIEVEDDRAEGRLDDAITFYFTANFVG